MQYKSYRKVRVATGATGEEFEENLNSILEEIQTLGGKYEIQFNTNMGHCAYVTYTYTKAIPETMTDEYELRGEEYECVNCPYFTKSTDKRVKYSYCNRVGRKIGEHSSACEYFYRQLALGEVKPCIRD